VVADSVACFDCKEYTEPASAARLVGSPPGYVGHQQRGLLADVMHKRPYRVLLFEDVDRAAPEVVGLIAQMLERGRITDNQGRLLDMRNSVIVLTTSAGSDAILSGNARPVAGFRVPTRPVGLTESDEGALVGHVRSCVGADICGRVDETVLFRPLGDEAAREVVGRAIQHSLSRLYAARLVRVQADMSVVDFVMTREGIDPRLGARSLYDRVQSTVVDHVAQRVVDGVLRAGSDVRLVARDGELVLLERRDDQPATAPTATDVRNLP